MRKIRNVVLVLLVMSVTMAGICVYGDDSKFSGEIQIISTTDTHGYAESDSSSMGYAKMTAVINQLRNENINTLVFDSGDTYEGMIYANAHKGKSVVPVVKAIGYDAMVTGNHEYSYGIEALKELTEEAGIPMVVSNVTDIDDNYIFNEYVIKDINGFKIGIMGLIGENTPNQTLPQNTQGLKFNDVEDSARKTINKLKSEDVNYIIALTHLGSAETEGYASINLANNVDGIDLILDGHSHVVNEGTIYNDTLLVASGYYTKSIGVIKLKIYNNEVIDERVNMMNAVVYEDIEPDEEVENIVEGYKAEYKKMLDNKICQTETFWNGEKYMVRNRETNLGRLIAESYIAKTGADIGLTNGGGVRASIEPGEVTIEDVYNTQPFGNYLVTKKISGQGVYDILETSLEQKGSGEFLQAAGIKVYCNEGKIQKITLSDGTEIDKNTEYIVGTSNYVATHNLFPELKLAEEINHYGTDYEATVEYIQKYGMKTTDKAIYDEGIYDPVELIVNSWAVESDTAPIETADGWYLPMRTVLESYGYNVEYDPLNKIVTATAEGMKVIKVDLNAYEYYVEGILIPVEMSVHNNRVMLDSDTICELFNCEIYTDGNDLILY